MISVVLQLYQRQRTDLRAGDTVYIDHNFDSMISSLGGGQKPEKTKICIGVPK